MSRVKDISTYYFVGIGGIGMSALARYFRMQDKAIYGYDRVSTPLTDVLSQEGMMISFVDVEASIPEAVLNNKDTLVVYTPAIPTDSAILNFFRREGYTLLKRAELLGEISKNTICLAVTGTHGKTTTSSILAHLMIGSGMETTAFLGGIAENYKSNFVYRGNQFMVVEADEYDRSFLQLYPDVACITSMDPDHLDIYGDALTVESAYFAFADLLASRDDLLVKKGLSLTGKTVAIETDADYQVSDLKVQDGSYVFDLKTPKMVHRNLVFHLPGRHNVLNAAMAFGMAELVGAPPVKLKEALASFKGVDRRFTYKIKTDDCVLIDDYAHHPVEIEALHQAVEEMYPNDTKQIIFQPHLYSRTRDFSTQFMRALSRFDEVVLLDIYPAREKPLPGVTSDALLEGITAPIKRKVAKSYVLDSIKNSSCRVHLMVGAGDIGIEITKITEALTS